MPSTFLGAGNYHWIELADSADTNNAFVRKDGGCVAWLRPQG